MEAFPIAVMVGPVFNGSRYLAVVRQRTRLHIARPKTRLAFWVFAVRRRCVHRRLGTRECLVCALLLWGDSK